MYNRLSIQGRRRSFFFRPVEREPIRESGVPAGSRGRAVVGGRRRAKLPEGKRSLTPRCPKQWQINLLPLYIFMRSRNGHRRRSYGGDRIYFFDGFVKITCVTLAVAEGGPEFLRPPSASYAPVSPYGITNTNNNSSGREKKRLYQDFIRLFTYWNLLRLVCIKRNPCIQLPSRQQWCNSS